MSTSSSSLPVVWCTDRNSVDNKPTAFALQGIHLQGNISEQHVLAVRELINAASEGRLLLPADGGVVVLTCGAGVGSLIVSSNENNFSELSNATTKGIDGDTIDTNNDKSKATDEKDEDERIRPNFHTGSCSNEVLYEFLCCARCMNEGTKCNSRTTQNSKIIKRYLDAKINAARAMRKVNANSKPLRNRKITKPSFKNEKRSIKRIQTNNALPIYATVNKKDKSTKNTNENKTTELANIVKQTANANDATETTLATEVVQFSSVIHESFRKTSFDSTCTISSMDSGFMEMQNKGEQRKLSTAQKLSAESIQINIEPPKSDDKSNADESVNKIESLNTWSRLTIPQQSRNRRKSYEEFKSLFCDQKSSLSNISELKNSSKSRRKSYEEFKSATSIIKNDNLNCDDNKFSGNGLLTNSKNNSNNENLSTFFSRMRRGSKRLSQKNNSKSFVNQSITNSAITSNYNNNNNKLDKKSINEHRDTAESIIYDILRKNETSMNSINTINLLDTNKVTKRNYDKNLELFENHCNEQNSKHNVKSCGTIYDIIQRRSDIYSKSCKKYDKYMTYGTLYEILHRKSDEGDQFDRKRTFSEKYSNKQRINYDSIKASLITSQNNANSANNNSGLFIKASSNGSVTDISEENLNSTSTSASASSLKQGSCSTNNQLSITSANGKQLSTIYDILQTKKLETSITTLVNNKNRFLVRKITEEELFEFQKETIDDSLSTNGVMNNMNNNSNHNSVSSTSINNDSKVILNIDEALSPISIDQRKQTKFRRFSNILSYTPKILTEFDLKTLDTHSDNETKTDVKTDEIYSRLNRISTVQILTNDHVHQQKCSQLHHIKYNKNNNHNNNGSMYKSNSLDMLSATEENQEFTVKQIPLRKISIPAHLPPKILPKKSTRRLSEFTRGEFLNEKL